MENQYTVKLTKQAQEQLREIVHSIAFDLQVLAIALRLIDTLETAIASLSQIPASILTEL